VVAAANVLSAGLNSGRVSDSDLSEVQQQREWPTRVIQSAQSFLQRRIIAGALNTAQAGNVPWQLRWFSKIPIVRDIPPRLIAFGPRRVRLKVV
jgi:hypothetical protein